MRVVFKMVYLAKRNPDTTHAEFLHNWKLHADLSATFPSIHDVYLGVIQCGSVATVSRPDISSDYDGVNLLPVRGFADALEVYDDPNIEVMLSDELRVFSTHVDRSALATIEIISSDKPIGSVVILEFARRRAGITEREFVRAWGGRRVRALNAVPAFTNNVGRHVRNLAVLDRPPGYEYDGIAELWFEGVEEAVALLDDAEYRSCGDDERFAVPLRLLLETNYVWAR